jgi:hypothetical protein
MKGELRDKKNASFSPGDSLGYSGILTVSGDEQQWIAVLTNIDHDLLACLRGGAMRVSHLVSSVQHERFTLIVRINDQVFSSTGS